MQYSKYTLENMQLFHTFLPKGARNIREHHHTECEISCILQGEGVYLINGTRYNFHAGDVLLFGSNEPHCIIEMKTDDFNMLTVKFEPRVLWNGVLPHAAMLLNLFFNHNKQFSNLISQNTATATKIKPLLLEMEQEFNQNQAGYTLKLWLNLYEALLLLYREYGYTDKSVTPPNTNQLLSAMDYMHQNLKNQMTLEEIASSVAMSKAYFSTLFKKYNGISPWEYITIKRVEMAIELLKTTNLKKIDIGYACGFQSPANFYKAFRHVTGKSPKDYQ